MKRRAFISLLGGAAAAWPLAARAQQSAMPVIGFLSSSTPVDRARYLPAFRQGLRETGYVEGQNVVIEYRWAQDQADRLPDLAADLVRRQVLVDPNYAATQSFVSDVQAAALSIAKQIEVLVEASTGRDIDTAFANLAQKPIDALVVAPSPLLVNRRLQLATLATYHRVPAIYSWREAAEVGGLMSYGTSLIDAYSQAGVYTGRILKGEKPADLPVMQSSKFEFVINLKTAKALGLTVPLIMQMTADEVIE